MSCLIAKSMPGRPIAELLEEGVRHHKAGRLYEAWVIYKTILAADPDHADGLHLLGMIFHQANRPDLALPCIGRALELNPTAANYRNSLGTVLRDLGGLDAAITQFGLALGRLPDSPEIWCNLGTALYDAGNRTGATAAYRTALALAPGLADLWYNLAAPLLAAGHPDAAETAYRRALRLRPHYAEATFNLGNLLLHLCRFDEAEAAFRAALLGRADRADWHNNHGVVLHEMSRLEEAETAYRTALRRDPDHPPALYNLGCVLLAGNRLDEALACQERALALKPDYAEARLALCMGQLPILYADEAELAPRRRTYEARLRRLAAAAERGCGAAALADAIGSHQPFFLPYQGEDDRALQSLYGSLACRLLADHRPPAALPPPPPPGRKIRIGMVSGYFHEHTIWRLFLDGWLRHLDRSRFELFGYHTGFKHDGCTDMAAAACDGFAAGRRTGREWRERILADRPDLLLYPEVGMDPVAGHLAAQRLAPVQCVSWGHPNTTGLPTMDYFLSSALMEPPGAEAFYTETLVRLPNLGTWYGPRAWPPATARREALGLRPGATVYWSGQALYKYLPQYDAVFPRIARAVGDCQFVFIEFARSAAVTALFRRRLDRAFAAWGLRASDHCVVLPAMPEADFIAALRLCDVALDTIGWSGGKSTLDGLAHPVPVVTLAGRFLRGRHTAAILQRMAVSETIAACVDDYVAIAARLARDGAWRAAIADRMAANRHRAFADRTYLAALEDFLAGAVASAALPRLSA